MISGDFNIRYLAQCKLCRRLFEVATRDWFRHMMNECHGLQWNVIKHEY